MSELRRGMATERIMRFALTLTGAHPTRWFSMEELRSLVEPCIPGWGSDKGARRAAYRYLGALESIIPLERKREAGRVYVRVYRRKAFGDRAA